MPRRMTGMIRWTAAIAGLTLAASLALAAMASASENSTAPPPPFGYAWVLKASNRMGTPMPSSAVWVASRRERAVEVTSGESVNSNQPVYVVVITGHFTARDVSVPEGAKFPTGTVATFIIDRATGTGLDFGLTNTRPNLGRLGRVHNLLPWLRSLTTASKVAVVPSLVTLPLDRALSRIHAAHLKVLVPFLLPIKDADLSTNGYAVWKQSPKAGVGVAPGSTIRIVLHVSFNGGMGGLAAHGTVLVPKLTGLSVQRAFRAALDAGLRVSVRAVNRPLRSLLIRHQSLKAGTDVRAGTVVTISP